MGTTEPEVAELLERARRLSPKERAVAEYFFRHISVGDLRAVLDLKKRGVADPQAIIDKLVEIGILEKGVDCYNLAAPLRRYFIRKRGVL